MNNLTQSDFPIAKDQYVAFDGLTIKEKIKQRLIQTGIFTDQNFEGSNLSALNDMIAMVFSLLLFYLNKTSNEGQFTEATIYENVNRIVKELDYHPIGHQTSTVSFSMSAKNLAAGIYTIPRYSSISVGGIKYSISEDFSFSKTTDNVVEEVVDNGVNILYQGNWVEFPTVTPSGVDNEIIYLTTTDNDIIDNFNIHVYVKSLNSKWERWTKTQSLFLNNSQDQVYEVRFNENKRYEIKFGNNINGKKLKTSDEVAIYYMRTDGVTGEIGARTLKGKVLAGYNTVRYRNIISDAQSQANYLNNTQMDGMMFDNYYVSSLYNAPESVESIKENAPATFRSQFRLVTSNDYEVFVRTNFSNIIYDVQAMNNDDYLNYYIKYFWELGLTRPQLESRALFNQTKFADSCNFNNIYLFVVPKTVGSNLSYLTPAQKSLMTETMQEEKVLTSELVIMDPVYIAYDMALSNSNTIKISDINNCALVLTKTPSSRRNDQSIVNDVEKVINDYFARKNRKLGDTIDTQQLTNEILSIEGIRKVYTSTLDGSVVVEGLRMISWNPVYDDISVAYANNKQTLAVFQFPYLFNTNFRDRIVITDEFYDIEPII